MESLQLLSCSGNSHSQCNQNVNKILHIIKSQVSPVYNFTFTILHFVQSHLRPVYSFAHYTESVKSRKQLCTLYRASEGCFTILHIIQRQLRLVYNFTHCTALVMIYMIYLLTAIGLSPGGSSTVHIYTIHRTTQITTNVERVRAVPRLCEFYPGICLTTEEKAWKNLSQVKKNLNVQNSIMVPYAVIYCGKVYHVNTLYWCLYLLSVRTQHLEHCTFKLSSTICFGHFWPSLARF